MIYKIDAPKNFVTALGLSQNVWRFHEYKKNITKIQRKMPIHLKTTFYNPGQNIWYKVEKSSKNGQDFKSLLSNLACFLTAIVKV